MKTLKFTTEVEIRADEALEALMNEDTGMVIDAVVDEDPSGCLDKLLEDDYKDVVESVADYESWRSLLNVLADKDKSQLLDAIMQLDISLDEATRLKDYFAKIEIELTPKHIIVTVIKSNSKMTWYPDKIGHNFAVIEDPSDALYYKVTEGPFECLYLLKEDCEVFCA